VIVRLRACSHMSEDHAQTWPWGLVVWSLAAAGTSVQTHWRVESRFASEARGDTTSQTITLAPRFLYHPPAATSDNLPPTSASSIRLLLTL